MQGNRSRDTTPELAVRRLLHAAGLRYRLQVAPVPGLRRTADIVFPRDRIAIFIDGCFWHGCPEHYAPPKANPGFWQDKVERNRARDADTTARFEAVGWAVLRFWTHEPPEAINDSVNSVIADARRPVAAVPSSDSPTRPPARSVHP